jgi:subtilisin
MLAWEERMKTNKTAFLLAFSLFFALVSPALAAKSATPDNRYFIKSKANLWKNSLGVRHTFSNGFTADLSDWQLRLVKIFGVEYEHVSRLSILPDDATPSVHDDTPASQVPWGVTMMEGTESPASTGGKDIVVAVLDTGVLISHPDLQDRVGDCQDFTTKQAVVAGKCEDKNGHGTHVAGIIAADGGAEHAGIYGLAPEATIFAYKVCDTTGSCWADDVAAALRLAADEGADIVNVSLGSDVENLLVSDAISYATDKGVLIVAAAGNDGSYAGSIDYPAASKAVVAVGAIDTNAEIPDWSSHGINTTTKKFIVEDKDIEFVAPGVNIESTWKDGGYAILSGTSMAAPHIAGLAARLWDAKDEHPAQAVRDALHKIATDILPEGDDDGSGFGIPALK